MDVGIELAEPLQIIGVDFALSLQVDFAFQSIDRKLSSKYFINLCSSLVSKVATRSCVHQSLPMHDESIKEKLGDESQWKLVMGILIEKHLKALPTFME